MYGIYTVKSKIKLLYVFANQFMENKNKMINQTKKEMKK